MLIFFIMTIQLAPNIYLQAPASELFRQDVEESLALLASKSVGKRLLVKIASASHKVFIRQGFCSHVLAGYSDISGRKDCSDRQKGSSSFIELQSRQQYALDLKSFHNRTNYVIGKDNQPIEQPFFITLAHELIHAHHNARGKNKWFEMSMDTTIWTSDEEFQTIEGFPSKKPRRTIPKITENAIRSEHGLPERYGHKTNQLPAASPNLSPHDDILTILLKEHKIISLVDGIE